MVEKKAEEFDRQVAWVLMVGLLLFGLLATGSMLASENSTKGEEPCSQCQELQRQLDRLMDVHEDLLRTTPETLWMPYCPHQCVYCDQAVWEDAMELARRWER
jgi:hypothetical protein